MEAFYYKGFGAWTNPETGVTIAGDVELNEDDTPSFFNFHAGGAIEVAPGAALILQMGMPQGVVPPDQVANIIWPKS